jgi:mannose-6-phosphate isomerase-like protein (cupin superfamily)
MMRIHNQHLPVQFGKQYKDQVHHRPQVFYFAYFFDCSFRR